MTLSTDEIARYSRHLSLPEVGRNGQERLKSASVLIVGLGGLGSPVALYLAAAGVGHLGLVDDDRVDASNLQRQVIHATPEIGTLKVESARDRILALNPLIQVTTHPLRASAGNLRDLIQDHEVIVDATDNLQARYDLSDAAAAAGKPLVYGSVSRFEGQLTVFDAKRGPCYRCLFPEPPSDAAIPACHGVMGVVPGIIGTLQAAEVLKLLLGQGTPLIGKLLLYKALESQFRMISIPKAPDCPICGAARIKIAHAIS